MTKFLTRPILAAQIIRAMSPSQVEQQESEGVLSCIPHFLDANALQFAPSNDSNDPQTLLPKLPKRTPMACHFCRGLALCTHILTQLIIIKGRKLKCDGNRPCCANCKCREMYKREKAHDTQHCVFTLPPSVMFSPLEDDNQVIISTSWMIVLSIIPSDLVRTGTILLGTLIVVMKVAFRFRPRTLIQTLQLRLLSLEENLQNSIDSGIMAQSDEIFTAQIERNMGRWVSMSRFLNTTSYVHHDAFFVEFDTGFLSFKKKRYWRLEEFHRR